MSQDRIVVVSGCPEMAIAITDFLSEGYQSQSICINKDYDNSPIKEIERSTISQAQVILIDMSTIRNYTPLLLSYLKTFNKKAPIILLNHYTESRYAKQMLQTGAAAYLPVTFQPEDLLKTIQVVQNNDLSHSNNSVR